jgi:hypothetical protein
MLLLSASRLSVVFTRSFVVCFLLPPSSPFYARVGFDLYSSWTDSAGSARHKSLLFLYAVVRTAAITHAIREICTFGIHHGVQRIAFAQRWPIWGP